MDLIVSTRNKDKYREIKQLFRSSGINVLNLDDFSGLPEVVEDGCTFEENAVKKALTVAKITKRLVVADDSGLEVPALNNAPGVYSARFSGKNATYESNNRKLLELLKGLPKSRRRARFVCCVAIADSDKVVGTVFGTCSGIIAEQPKGRKGFGYDPVFIYPALNKTFAQISAELKNSISHRSRAFQKAKTVVLKYLKTTGKKGKEQ